MTQLQLLLQEEERLARNVIDEKTQQALEAHGQQVQSCQEELAALEAFSRRIREIQQCSDPIQFLEVVLRSVSLPLALLVPGELLWWLASVDPSASIIFLTAFFCSVAILVDQFGS